MEPSPLPAVNACLNTASAVLLVLGYVFIKRGKITPHKACMLAALAVSAAFLGCYLYYHFVVRKGVMTQFAGPAEVKTFYLAILFSHVVLAIIVAPLALWTAYLGIRDRLDRHRLIARWTLPLWLYVSVTGVVVYWMLYQLYAS